MKTLLMLVTAMLALAVPPAIAQQYATASTDEPSAEQAFTVAELDQLLAPIALYPDALLSQILMASSYPLEVVEAARWSCRRWTKTSTGHGASAMPSRTRKTN